MRSLAFGGVLVALGLFFSEQASAQVLVRERNVFIPRQRVPKTLIEMTAETNYLRVLQVMPAARLPLAEGRTGDALQNCMQADRKGALDYVEQLRQGIKPVPADVSRESQEFQACYRQQFDLFALLPIKLEPPPGTETGATPSPSSYP